MLLPHCKAVLVPQGHVGACILVKRASYVYKHRPKPSGCPFAVTGASQRHIMKVAKLVLEGFGKGKDKRRC